MNSKRNQNGKDKKIKKKIIIFESFEVYVPNNKHMLHSI